MHNRYVLVFLLTFDLVSLFPLCRTLSVIVFSFTKGKKHKIKATELHNKLKPTVNKLKMSICQLTLYLNYFNENKLMFGNFLNFFSFFWSIVKLICELWHSFFINLRLQQILNLWSSTLLYKNPCSATGKFAHSAVCHPPYPCLKTFYNLLIFCMEMHRLRRQVK